MFRLTTKIIEDSETSTIHNSSSDFFAASNNWQEEWVVRDETGRIVSQRIVDRQSTTGMQGIHDHWDVCSKCGSIEWMTHDDDCVTCQERSRRKPRTIKTGFKLVEVARVMQ